MSSTGPTHRDGCPGVLRDRVQSALPTTFRDHDGSGRRRTFKHALDVFSSRGRESLNHVENQSRAVRLRTGDRSLVPSIAMVR